MSPAAWRFIAVAMWIASSDLMLTGSSRAACSSRGGGKRCKRHEWERPPRACLDAFASTQASQLHDQQLAGVPRIEPCEHRADEGRIILTEHHPTERRCVDVDARHSMLAVVREPRVRGAGRMRSTRGDDVVEDSKPVGKRLGALG